MTPKQNSSTLIAFLVICTSLLEQPVAIAEQIPVRSPKASLTDFSYLSWATVELLANGNVLIADENNNRAMEVTHVYGEPSSIVRGPVFTMAGGLSFSGVAFASRRSAAVATVISSVVAASRA